MATPSTVTEEKIISTLHEEALEESSELESKPSIPLEGAAFNENLQKGSSVANTDFRNLDIYTTNFGHSDTFKEIIKTELLLEFYKRAARF